MRFVKRVVLFLITNIAILLIISVIFSFLGVKPYLTAYGLDLKALLIYAAMIGFAGSFISLLLSKTMAKWMMRVHVIDTPRNQEEKRIFDIVSRLSKKLDFKKIPEVGIYISPEVNAFATGFSKSHALVAVSSGLLSEMNDEELEGVLGHEMSHIENGDMVTMTLIQGIVNTFVIFTARVVAFVVGKILSGKEEISRGLYYLLSIVFEIIFGIIASIIVLWFSRLREFRADAGSAKLVGKQKMIAGLEKLKSLQGRVDISHRQKQFSTMKITDKKGMFGMIFSTHPSLEERIAALQKL